MRYLLLIYSNTEAWEHPLYLHEPEFLGLPDAERAELVGRAEDLLRGLTESGELVEGTALADPRNSRTVRVRAGTPATTDGPFAEAKEHLAGYLVVDCVSAERAAEIAASFPAVGLEAVEVRPIVEEASVTRRGAADGAVHGSLERAD